MIKVQKEYHILNLGAGVQSSTLFLMQGEKGIPFFDYAIFADTQDEPKEVYKHLEWLKLQKKTPIITATKGRLSDEILHNSNNDTKRFITIPAFTYSPGDAREGQVRRQCTKEYKIDIIEHTIKREILGLRRYKHISKKVHIHQYIGISLDEMRRKRKIEERFQNIYWSTVHFPLIDLQLTRADCINWLKQYGIPHEPPRSACTFCPYKSNEEWQKLKEGDLETWNYVIKVDEALRNNRNLDKPLYLHRSCKPISQIDFLNNNKGDIHMAGECEGMCGN